MFEEIKLERGQNPAPPKNFLAPSDKLAAPKKLEAAIIPTRPMLQNSRRGRRVASQEQSGGK
jgi:hypothetical protein